MTPLAQAPVTSNRFFRRLPAVREFISASAGSRKAKAEGLWLQPQKAQMGSAEEPGRQHR